MQISAVMLWNVAEKVIKKCIKKLKSQSLWVINQSLTPTSVHAQLEVAARRPERVDPDQVDLGCKKGFELNLNFKLFWIFELSLYLELSNVQRA